LIGIVRSVHAAAKLTKGNLQAISFACTGKYVASGGYYFRFVHTDIEIRIDNLNVLKLEEYDKLCGEDRKYYTKKQLQALDLCNQQKQKKVNKRTNSEEKL
jgi:hypothetical protein